LAFQEAAGHYHYPLGELQCKPQPSHAVVDEPTKVTNQAGNQDIEEDMGGTGDDDQASQVPARTQEIVITSAYNTTITTTGGALVILFRKLLLKKPSSPATELNFVYTAAILEKKIS